MEMRSLLLSSLFLVATNSAAAQLQVFQGSCSSPTVVCDELCLTVSQETHQCDCWAGRRLTEDGVSCRALQKAELKHPHHHQQHHHQHQEHSSTGAARKLEEEEADGEWMERIRTATEPVAAASAADNASEDGSALAFDGHNYAHFAAPASAYLETNVTIEFRADSPEDGLLLYGGMFAEEDFLSLALVGGNLVLRFDCGEGISTETYYGPFSLRRWHSIRIKRKYCTRSELTVDAMATLLDERGQYQNYKGISMGDGLYVGGAPADVEFLDAKTTVTRGFSGCVRRVIVNEVTLLDASAGGVNAMINKEALKRCRPVIAAQAKQNDSVEGMIRRDYHHNHVEVTTKLPVTTSSSTTTTTKAPPTSVASTTAVPPPPARNVSVEFSGGVFLEQRSPIDIEQYLDLDVHFKPKRNHGLLFHWADGAHRLSVFLQEGFVQAELSLGGDERMLRSLSPVSLNAWHSVQVYRSGKGILMKVDRQRFVDTEVDGTDQRALSAGKTFIGGANIRLPAHIQALGNYVGCLWKIRLNAHLLSLTHAPSRTADAAGDAAAAAAAADSLPVCSTDPCSGARCPHDCAASEDLTKHACLCAFPAYGERCGSTFSMAEGAMRLNGDGYLLLKDPAVMNHITGDKLRFSMEIRHNGTIEREQVLAYAGDLADDDDFMQIGLNPERKVVVTMNLGSGEVQLTHGRPLPHGRWATVDVVRTRRAIRLTVDGEAAVSADAPEGSDQLNVYDAISIGGRPSPLHLRGDGFSGCIEWVKIDATVLTSPRQAAKAVNVAPCH